MVNSIAITTSIKQQFLLLLKSPKYGCSRNIIIGKRSQFNLRFVIYSNIILFSSVFALLALHLLLLQSGDIHPNPGPSSVASDISDSSASSILNSLNLSRHLSFVHYNIQSIVPKLDILTAELSDFDILAFSETWLSPTVTSEELFILSYHPPERKDRIGDSHGGVILYVKDTLHFTRRHDLEPVGVECLWIELNLKHKKLLLGLFYRPPSSNSAYFSSIEDSIYLAVDTGIKDIVITGDLNYNMLNIQASSKIKSLCEQFSLVQIINDPTHYTEHSHSLIDIILTNNVNHLVLSGVGDPFLNQDMRYHCPIFGIFNFRNCKRKSYLRHTWSYDRGDYTLLRQKATETIWENLYDLDVNKHAQKITDHITHISKTCIPNRQTRIRPDEPVWINSNIKRYIRKRKRAYKKAKGSNNNHLWQKFRHLRNTVIDMIRKSKNKCKENTTNKLKSQTLSSKDWWSTLKSVISPNSKTSIPPLKKDDIIISDDLEKANALNDFFRDQSLISVENARLPQLVRYNVISELSTLTLIPTEIEAILKSLPLGKATGPDGIHNRVLRELATELSVPLTSLFNQSLHTGIFPECWKLSNVCPIPKSGDRSALSNHRPVSLLCTIEKSFERAVFKHIYNHLHDNNILTSLQSGFIPGDSTVNQLAYLYNAFCQALDTGKEVRVVFCDISKAFDRVWHEGLLLKLEAAGISGNLLAWFRSYLTNRKQRVVLPGVESDWNYIRAGVPQGSILGPLLFLLFINDIVTDIGSNIRLFADDTSLYIIVDNPTTAAELLNLDLEKIIKWAKTWLVTFNPLKTETLLISRKLTKPYHPPLHMDNQIIAEVDTHKHLGIYLSNDCTWHKHIDYVKDKAWARINIMRKLKFELDRKSLETIYLTFIRPILEYGDIVWDNCTLYEKQELDKIQTEAARIVTGTTKLISIQTLYDEIKWETLESRRNKHKLVLFYKMFNNISPVYLSSLVPPSISSISTYNLRNAENVQTIDSRTSQYCNSFLPSAVREWNNLPLETRSSDSVNTFKRSLDRGATVVPKYYYSGNRKFQILHTRLRTNCSSLNNDLFLKNILESPLCHCGNVENTEHYFMHCQIYQAQRAELIQTISQFSPFLLQTLLYGNNNLPLNTNTLIFDAVQKYIKDTKRF